MSGQIARKTSLKQSARAEKSEGTFRQAILDAARELFALEGYERVSMRRIGAQAGCSAMAIYRHFTSKEEMLVSICEDTFAKITPQGDDDVRFLGRTPIERLRQAMRIFIQYGIENPNHFRLTFLTALPQGPIARRRVQIGQRSLVVFQKMVGECAKAKNMQCDVELRTHMLRVGAIGVISGSLVPAFTWKGNARLIEAMIQAVTQDLE